MTEWGGHGGGAGQFNVGQGLRLATGELDFAGSIAVDDEGFIYVADQDRIQKFAP